MPRADDPGGILSMVSCLSSSILMLIDLIWGKAQQPTGFAAYSLGKCCNSDDDC